MIFDELQHVYQVSSGANMMRVGSRTVAEDMLQEPFVRGLARAGRLRNQESIIAWFNRALRNAIEQRLFDVGAVPGEYAEPTVSTDLMATAFESATELVGTLKPEHSSALRQIDLDGVSVKLLGVLGKGVRDHATPGKLTGSAIDGIDNERSHRNDFDLGVATEACGP